VDPLRDALTAALPDLAAGGQLWARVGSGAGPTVALVTGEVLPGEPLTGDHVFNVYCAAKPVAVMAALASLERAGVATGPAVPLAELLPVPPSSPLGSLTFGELLANRVGLAEPDLFRFLTSSDAARAGMLAQLDRSLPGRGRRPERSTLALAHVLGLMVERAAGVSLEEAIDGHLAAVGLTRTFVRVPAGRAPIGVYADRRPSGGERKGQPRTNRVLPLLHDRLPYFADSPYGALVGLYTTAGDLGAWGACLAAVARGSARPGFPDPEIVRAHLSGARSPSSRLHFAAGLAVALPAHGLPSAPAPALASVGFVRSSLLYVDPESEVVLAGIHCDLALDALDGRMAAWDQAVAALVRAA
jgi:CubicO group peptidase (beta-lactamase class C family)